LRLTEQPWAGFAAVAGFPPPRSCDVRPMRTEIVAIDACALRRGQLGETALQSGVVVGRVVAARDSRLVAHHDDDEAALIQAADRLARAREQFYPIGLVQISGVVDNRAVAVEEGRALTHEGLRLRYPPVRERLCAHRATRGCPRPAR